MKRLSFLRRASLRFAALAVFGIFALSSCEEVIDYKLKTEDTKLVIEGLVTNQPGPYTVKISTTKGYLDQGNVPFVDAALVTITDETTGVVDTLLRTTAGIYQTTARLGVGQINHRYRLRVLREGREYGAVSTLRYCSPLDSITFKWKTPQNDLVSDSGYYATIYFREPAGRGDYYRFNVYQNGIWRNRQEVAVFDDEFYDGNYGDPEIGYTLQAKDTILVELRSIDKPAYDYYVGLAAAQQNQGTPFDSPPANAPTNITGGAIGFFGASSISTIKRNCPARHP